ncbi:MAG: PspC domain-containing protein [Nanoarchaeota archaeon]
MFNLFGMTFLFGISMLVAIALLLVWLWALVDCLRSDKDTTDKLFWVLIIILLNIIGAILYFALKERPQKKSSKKRLTRPVNDRILAGVCAGIAEYFETDPTLIRLAWVVLSFMSVGTGLLLYLIAALIIPKQHGGKKSSPSESPRYASVAIVVAVASVLIVLIVAASIVAIVGITQFRSQGAHASARIERAVQAPRKADVLVYDYVLSHPNYRRFAGSNLTCDRIVLIDESMCRRMSPGQENICYRVSCKYDTATAGVAGYVVDAVVSPSEILEIGFRQVTESVNVTLEDDPLPPRPEQQVMPDPQHCTDECGDGVCQEMVCTAVGCPCAETADSCPQDC